MLVIFPATRLRLVGSTTAGNLWVTNQTPLFDTWSIRTNCSLLTGRWFLRVPTAPAKLCSAAYVAADIASKSEHAEAIFWTAAEFSGRFRAICETDSGPEWRRRLVDTSCLVIDDLDKLDTHPSAQQELVQVLDMLGHKFVPFISTASQKFLQSDRILPQLGSRLSGGLCLAVQPPGLHARREIIHWLLHEMRLDLTEEAIEYLAHA